MKKLNNQENCPNCHNADNIKYISTKNKNSFMKILFIIILVIALMLLSTSVVLHFIVIERTGGEYYFAFIFCQYDKMEDIKVEDTSKAELALTFAYPQANRFAFYGFSLLIIALITKTNINLKKQKTINALCFNCGHKWQI